MKILILTHFYKPEIGAGSIRIQYFVESLQAANHQVKIVTPIPNYPFGKVYSGYTNKVIIDKKESVVNLPIYLPSRRSVLSRGLSYLSFFFRSIIFCLFDKFKPELIITSSPPIFTSFAAVLIAKIKKIPVIVDLRDIWPDIGVALGLIKKKMFIKILQFIESYILRNASVLIVTAEGDRKNLIEKKISNEKIYVIYNGADIDLYTLLNEDERKKVRIQHNLPLDKKLLIYFGSFNFGMNDTDLLGSVLISLEKWKNLFYLIIVGHGENYNSFISRIDSKIDYLHINSLTSIELSALVAASDLSLIPRKKLNKNTGGNIPVKCFESWATGVPVIISADRDSEIMHIYSKCPAGYFIEPENVEVFSGTILKFLQEYKNDEIGRRAREFVSKNFDRRIQAQKIVGIIEDRIIKKTILK